MSGNQVLEFLTMVLCEELIEESCQRKLFGRNLFPGGVVTPGPEMVVSRSGLGGLVALALVHFITSDKSLR